MDKKITSIKFGDTTTHDFVIPLPKKCSVCGVSSKAELICSYFYEKPPSDGDDMIISNMYFCFNCNNFYFGTYVSDFYGHATEALLLPNYFEKRNFSNPLTSLSGRFVEVYNQALRAESLGLVEVCGMAYRKSLEILVKDFSICNNPDQKDSILKMPLSQCIDTYIENPKLKSLAKASAFLGNDETHYIRKFEDYGLKELKSFIETIITHIDFELNYLQAHHLTANRQK